MRPSRAPLCLLQSSIPAYAGGLIDLSESRPMDTPTLLCHIAPGQERFVPLNAGSELFCRQGTLHLASPLQGLALALHTGQGWRASEDLWVHLATAGPQSALVELRETAHASAQKSRPAPLAEETGRLWEAGLGVLRRGLRAASWKTP